METFQGNFGPISPEEIIRNYLVSVRFPDEVGLLQIIAGECIERISGKNVRKRIFEPLEMHPFPRLTIGLSPIPCTMELKVILGDRLAGSISSSIHESYFSVTESTKKREVIPADA